MSTSVDISYKAEPTAVKFHASSKFVRAIMGPVGSGKTSACCMEVFLRSCEQRPHNGVRRTRWALIRQTFPQLLTTTLKTWEEWVPREICKVTKGTPIRGMLEVDLPDGTRVESEIIFLAMDIEDDANKLKSLELTGAFINEASEIRKSAFDLLTSRVDRFPSKQQGGPTWTGIIMDTNPPDDDHWWYNFAEKEKPDGYLFLKQPPALIRIPPKKSGDAPTYIPNEGNNGVPAAENINNHNSGFEYYLRMVAGKDDEWIKVFVLGQYGSFSTGKPVYPEYADSVHISGEPLKPYKGLPILLGWDFGLTPSCIVAQLSPRCQLRVLGEKYSEDMGIERFSRDIVKPWIAESFGGMPFHSIGDPAGGGRSQADELTCFQMLEMQGLPTEPAPTNKFNIRRECVAWFLTKLTDGQPGFLLDPECHMLRKGFMGSYSYRRMKVGGGDRFTETPDKNEFSHPHDALQYICSFLRSGHTLDSNNLPGFGKPGCRPVTYKDLGAWD